MSNSIQQTLKDLDSMHHKLGQIHSQSHGGGHGGGHKGGHHEDPVKHKQKELVAIHKLHETASKHHIQSLKHEQKNELHAAEHHEKAITALKSQHQNERLANEKGAAQESVAATAGSLDTTSSLHKKFGEMQKATMIAQTTMSTYSSAQNAYTSALGSHTVFGLAAAPIAAGVAVAAGLANVGMISAQKFEQGGPVFGPSHSNGGVPAVLEGGEYILPRNTVARMGGFQGVENSMGSGGATYQTVAPVLNVHVAGNADGNSVNNVKMSVRQELQSMARNLRLLGMKPAQQGYYMTRA